MKFIRKITKFDKVVANIKKEHEIEMQRRLKYIEENPDKKDALLKDKEEEEKLLKESRKIGFKETFFQIWDLLSGMRRKLPVIFGLMLMNSFLGFVSMSMMVPFALALNNIKNIGQNIDTSGFSNYKRITIEALQYVYDAWNMTSTTTFIIILGAAFIIIFIVRNIFGMYIGYVLGVYSAEATRHFSGKMFSALLYISYTYYLGRDSARTMYALGLAGQCYGIIISLFSTIQDVMIAIFISLGIAFWSPTIIVVGVLIFAVSFIVYRLSHLELKRLGEISLYLGQIGNRNVYQGIHNFTFSRLLHTEPFFTRLFNKLIDYNIPIGAYKGIISGMPRFVVENLLLIAFIGYSVYKVGFTQEDSGDVLTSALVLAYAALKLMPAALRISGYLGTLAGDQVNIDEFYKEYTTALSHTVDEGEHEHIEPLPFQDKIEITNLSFAYPVFDRKGIKYSYKNSAPVLQDVSFTIKKGEKIGVVGSSGGGKTTMVNLLMAFLEPLSGDVTVDGVSIFKNMRSWHKNIGYVPQDTMLMSATVLENIAFGVETSKIDMDRAIEALKSAHLWDVVENMPLGIKTTIGDSGKRMSGGQRQRLGIARALYRNPNIVFFDEATSHLDHKTEKEVQKAIDDIDNTKTVIIVAHRLNTLEKCDRIYAFDKGEIAFVGSYKDMIKKYG